MSYSCDGGWHPSPYLRACDNKYIRARNNSLRGAGLVQVDRWFAKATTFEDVARESVEKQRYDFACFTAQQAVEFCLKGILISKVGMKSYSHSLDELMKAVGSVGIQIPPTVLVCAKTLGEHYLQARYPDARMSDYTLAEAEDAIKCMEVALDFLRGVREATKKERGTEGVKVRRVR